MTELDAVVEDWQRGLCVVAHPDDLEFGTAAAIARWTDQGKTIVYAMVTSGEAGIDGLEPEECRRVREAEQIASARIVGVDTVDFLGQPDGILEYGVALRAVICAAVRRYCPEIVITNNFRDTWGGTSLNQADHIATGKATLDAVRDAGNRWIFREQIEGPTGGSAATTGHSGELGQKGGGSAATTGHSGELGQKGGGSAATTGHSGELGQKGGGSAATTGHSGELGGMAPWGGVREVWAAGSPASTHGVETTATFARGVDSLRAHQAYIDGLGWELFDPEEFLEGAARPTGTRLGVPMATSFEVFRMGWGE